MIRISAKRENAALRIIPCNHQDPQKCSSAERLRAVHLGSPIPWSAAKDPSVTSAQSVTLNSDPKTRTATDTVSPSAQLWSPADHSAGPVPDTGYKARWTAQNHNSQTCFTAQWQWHSTVQCNAKDPCVNNSAAKHEQCSAPDTDCDVRTGRIDYTASDTKSDNRSVQLCDTAPNTDRDNRKVGVYKFAP